MLKNWLKNDTVSLGFILGLIIPLVSTLMFAMILRLLQNILHILGRTHEVDIVLLGVAVNIIVMRYFLVKLRFEKAGKTILLLTVFMILFFFIFLKNSNFAFPF